VKIYAAAVEVPEALRQNARGTKLQFITIHGAFLSFTPQLEVYYCSFLEV
jgi:hypothetical protein